MAGKPPDNEQDIIGEMEKHHETGGNRIVSGQRNEGYRYDGEFHTVFRDLADNAQILGFTKMKHYTIIIGAEDVTECVERYHLPISTAEYGGIGHVRP